MPKIWYYGAFSLFHRCRVSARLPSQKQKNNQGTVLWLSKCCRFSKIRFKKPRWIYCDFKTKQAFNQANQQIDGCKLLYYTKNIANHRTVPWLFILTVVYSCGTLLLGTDSLTVSTLNCGVVMKCESVSVIIASHKGQSGDGSVMVTLIVLIVQQDGEPSLCLFSKFCICTVIHNK